VLRTLPALRDRSRRPPVAPVRVGASRTRQRITGARRTVVAIRTFEPGTIYVEIAQSLFIAVVAFPARQAVLLVCSASARVVAALGAFYGSWRTCRAVGSLWALDRVSSLDALVSSRARGALGFLRCAQLRCVEAIVATLLRDGSCRAVVAHWARVGAIGVRISVRSGRASARYANVARSAVTSDSASQAILSLRASVAVSRHGVPLGAVLAQATIRVVCIVVTIFVGVANVLDAAEAALAGGAHLTGLLLGVVVLRAIGASAWASCASRAVPVLRAFVLGGSRRSSSAIVSLRTAR